MYDFIDFTGERENGQQTHPDDDCFYQVDWMNFRDSIPKTWRASQVELTHLPAGSCMPGRAGRVMLTDFGLILCN
jgi:hypothetical protein